MPAHVDMSAMPVILSRLILLLLFIPGLSWGARPLASDDFESGGWQSGTGWSAPWRHSGSATLRQGGEAHGGAFFVQLRGGTAGMTRRLDLSGGQGVHLRFWYRLQSFKKGDRALLQVNDGVWHQALRLEGPEKNSAWQQADVDLSAFGMEKNFRIRFEIHSGSRQSRLFLDDIQLISDSPAPDPRGQLSFYCDWEQQITGGSCWDELYAAGEGRFVRVTDPVRQGRHAVRVEVRPGDDPLHCEGCGERSEVSNMRDQQGRVIMEDEHSGVKFYAFSIMLDAGWQTPEPEDDGLWGIVFQLHGPDELDASQSVALDVTGIDREGEGFNIILNGGDLDDPDNSLQSEAFPLSDPDLNKGHWVDFILKIRFASDFSGAVDVWRRNEGEEKFRHVLALRDVPTLQYRSSVNHGRVGPHNWQHGFYRPRQKHITNVLWLDRVLRGSRLADVMAAMNPSSRVKLQPAADDGIYFAAFPDFGEDEDQVSRERIRAFEELAGRKIAWAPFSQYWSEGMDYPRDKIQIIHDSGAVPLVRLQPRSTTREYVRETRFTLERIIQGDFDAPLARWARDARDHGIPLLVDFGIEVNGRWFPWNGYWNGGGILDGYGDPAYPDGPERFRDAYRHIIDLFRAQGADNITWFFHLTMYMNEPPDEWNQPRYYYPGDDYIDWIGVSIYGALHPGEDYWDSFEEILTQEDANQKIRAVSANKPLAILEMGVTDHHPRGSKAQWLRDAFEKIRGNPYLRFRAVTYWHENWDNEGSQTSLRIDSSPEALAAFRESVADPAFVSTPVFSGTGSRP
ncbi:heparin lyase I family protein [Thiolapillus sp.]